jgi:ubiquinone/menaquinone biosynthesis C-methylase UbiE
MSDYILPHSDPLEDDRLMVMSKMLDPHMRFRLSLLGPLEGWKCLEVGAGNGTMSLARRPGRTEWARHCHRYRHDFSGPALATEPRSAATRRYERPD